MDFRLTRSGSWGYLDIDYNIKREPGKERTLIEFSGNINGEFDDVEKISVLPPHSFWEWNCPQIIDVEDNEITDPIEFSFKKSHYNNSIDIHLCILTDEGEFERFKLTFARPIWHQYITNILKTDNTIELTDKLFENLQEKGINKYQIIAAASKILKTKKYFQFCDILHRDTPYFSDHLTQSIEKYVSRLFIPDSRKSRRKSDRMEYLDAINQTSSFDFSHDDLIQMALTEAIEGGKQEELLLFIDKLGSSEFPMSGIDRWQIAYLIGYGLTSDRPCSLEALLDYLSEEPPEEFEEPTDLVRGSDINQRSEMLSKILKESHEKEHNFEYITAHYLTFFDESYNIDEIDEDIQKKIVEFGLELAKQIDDQWLISRARYKLYILEGVNARKSNQYRESKYSFSEAILTLTRSDTWNQTAGFSIQAVWNLALTEIFEVQELNDYDQAANIADEKITVIEEIEAKNEKQKENIINRLKGLRAKNNAFFEISNDRYEDALQYLNSATSSYSIADEQEQKKYCIARRHEIHSLQYELDGQFDQAADEHKSCSEMIPDGGASKYHSVRSKICKVKSHLNNSEIEQGANVLYNLKREEDLKPDQLQLLDLITIIRDYKDNKTTEVSDLHNPILDDQAPSEHVIDVQDNFIGGIVVGLAAQRFDRYQFPKEFLDESVDIAIYECLIPNSILKPTGSEINIRPDIRNLNTDVAWRTRLPEHVIDSLNDIETRQELLQRNYKGLCRDLAVTLERHLAVVIDYVGNRRFGTEWLSEIDEDPEAKPTLGMYLKFLDENPGKVIQSIDDIHSLLDNPVPDSEGVASLRNDLMHGYEPKMAEESNITEDLFEELKDVVKDMIRYLSANTPVIVRVEGQHDLGNGFELRLYWGKTSKKTWIKTDMDLTVGEYYYIPQQQITLGDLSAVEENRIIECRESRFLSWVKN